ncbi:MAG: molybdopterin molybdenumtransferase MoeA, partial [Planktomarina sp.]
MISVAKALDQLSDLVRPLQTEVIPLKHAQGRIMVEPAVAQRDQPPFSASAMDGYAVGAADLNTGMTQWTVIGESAAGHRY